MKSIVAVVLIAASLAAHADVAQDVVRAPALDRECLLAAAGGATPELLDAMSRELKPLARTLKPPELRALGLFLERHAREQRVLLPLAKALGAIGASYFSERQYSLAEPYDAEALELARLAEDDETIAAQLQAMGIYASLGGRPNDAVDLLQEALTRTKQERTTALIHNALALAHRTAGNLAQSVEEFDRARELFTKLEDRDAIAGVTNNLGNTALQLGDFEQATVWFEKALQLADAVKNDRIRAFALNNLGNIATKRGQLDRAQRWFEESLALKQRLGEKPGIAVALINLGEIARLRGKRVAAFTSYMQARTLAEEIGDRAQAAIAETDAALLAMQRGHPHVALYFANRALAVGRGNLPLVVIQAATARGDALRALGQRDEARASYAEGIAAVEAQRKQAGGSEQQRAQFLELRLNPYLGMVSLLAGPDPAAALRYAEQAKARVLLDLLQRDGTNESSTFASIAPGTAAVEFVVTPTRTFAFVITESGVRARGVGITDEQLARDVRALRTSLAQRDLGFDAASSKLFELLLGKVWPLVRGKKSLIVIPDGALWELPFQALRTKEGKYVAEETAIAYAPSLTTLAGMRHAATTHREAAVPLLAFGNPPASGGLASLPEASRQLDAIAKLYGTRSRVYTGAAATERRLRDEIANARVVQIATHGVLNGDNPLYSHLLFARGGREDGRLEARELVKLPLQSDLVVLSACDTARGTTRQGEGVIGMAWALFLARSPSTVVSQWAVDSTSAAETMIRFHRHLRAGEAKSTALRKASLDLLRDPRTRHPFYWAGFIVIGDDSPVRF